MWASVHTRAGDALRCNRPTYARGAVVERRILPSPIRGGGGAGGALLLPCRAMLVEATRDEFQPAVVPGRPALTRSRTLVPRELERKRYVAMQHDLGDAAAA